MSYGTTWIVSKLAEVMIESKRDLNAELFHNDFARAVGEAPTFIVELLKCLPRMH